MYESRDTALCVEAEKELVAFQTSNTPNTLSKCQMLLERADSHYSQLLAATTITKLLSRTPLTLNLDQRIQISKFLTTNHMLLFYNNFNFRKLHFELFGNTSQITIICGSSTGIVICKNY